MSHEKIDIDQVVGYLSHAFEKVCQQAQAIFREKPERNQEPTGSIPNGNRLYRYQVEFCYLIDDIQRGPQYIIPKKISDANELIDQLETEIRTANSS